MIPVTQKKFAFVLMPFSKEFDNFYQYGIKQSCEELNVYCERVDEQIFHESILDRIFNQISKADILIADMSGRNANVFYEVGYAHGIGKKVILLTQSESDIPFDFRHFPHIVYGSSIQTLSNALKSKISFFLKEPQQRINNLFNLKLNIFFNSQKIKENETITIASNFFRNHSAVSFDIFNDSSIIVTEKIILGFEASQKMSKYFVDLSIINLENNNALFLTREFSEIYPHAWTRVLFHFKTTLSDVPSEFYDIVFKIFTPIEVIQYPCKFYFEKIPTKIII